MLKLILLFWHVALSPRAKEIILMCNFGVCKSFTNIFILKMISKLNSEKIKQLEQENFDLKEKNFMLEQQLNRMRSNKKIPIITKPEFSKR